MVKENYFKTWYKSAFLKLLRRGPNKPGEQPNNVQDQDYGLQPRIELQLRQVRVRRDRKTTALTQILKVSLSEKTVAVIYMNSHTPASVL